MNMRKATFGLLPLVLAFAVVGIAAYPAAAANTTILPMSPFILTYNNLSDGDTITGDWSSDGTLTFVLTGPGGTLSTYTGTSNIVFHICMDDGDYVLTWTNMGTTNSVVLEYDITKSGAGGFLDDIGTAILIGLLVFVAVIVIVIVIVVLVVMRGKKSKQAAAAGPVITPAVGGNCPVCGMPVDPQVSFCAKCGAKLR